MISSANSRKPATLPEFPLKIDSIIIPEIGAQITSKNSPIKGNAYEKHPTKSKKMHKTNF